MPETWPDGRTAAVTITFDGGYASSLRHALPLLEARGMASTWFLVADAVGGQIEGRAVAGWPEWRAANPVLVELGNHSSTHPLVRRGAGEMARHVVDSPGAVPRAVRRVLRGADPVGEAKPAGTASALPVTAALEDFRAGKSRLETNLARPVTAFAYPNGRARPRLARGVERMGHRSARTSIPGTNDPARLNRFALRAETWTASTTHEESRRWLDAAQREGGWLIEVLHVVDTGGDYPWTTTPDALAGHLDALEAADVWVATQSAVVDHVANATVPIAARGR